MDAPAVRLTFEITFDEFREAVLAVQRVNTRKQQAVGSRKPVGCGAAALAIVSSIVGVVLIGVGFWAEEFPQIRPPHYVLFTLLMPGAVIATASLLLFWSQRVQLTETPGGWPARVARFALSFTPAVVVLVLMLAFWLPRALEGPGGVYDWFGTFFPHVAWVFFVVLVFTSTARATRQQVQRLWEQQPLLSRTRAVEVGPAGLTVDEAVAFRRYAWPSLVRFIETERLLLACPSEVTFEILPKRAFASPDELNAARGLLQSEVRDPDTAPFAFAVGPPAPGRRVPPTST